MSSSAGAGESPLHYSINLTRLQFVETAEDRVSWYARARRQWGGGKLISVKLSNSTTPVAATAPKAVEMRRQWCGIDLGSDDIAYDVPQLAQDGMLVLEVVSAGVVPPIVLGIAVVNLRSFVMERRTYGRNSVIVFPTTAPSEQVVHAVIDFEVRTDGGAHHARGGGIMSPLEYSFGCLRLSSLDLYFPSFLIDSTKGGEYIVSNVICAYNNTEDDYITLSFVVRGPSAASLVVHPQEAVVVRPQQRSYFSVTWNVSSAAQLAQVPEVQLSVVGGHGGLTAPVVFRVHFSAPKPDDLDAPFQYWVNTTCLTNRCICYTNELPYIKSVLPIFFMIEKAATGSSDADDALLVRDRDKGTSVTVIGGPSTQHSPREEDADELMDLTDVSCECVLTLGALVGFPLLSSSSSQLPSGALSPSFRIIATLMNAEGWRLITSETDAHYQLPSGRIPWNETLRLEKKGSASCSQFLKLHLVEVSPRDDDETPVGTAMVSLAGLNAVRGRVAAVHAAFYINDCCSLYDDLSSTSVLLKGCSMRFVV